MRTHFPHAWAEDDLRQGENHAALLARAGWPSRNIAAIPILGAVKAPIAGVQLGSAVEDLPMTIQRSLHWGGVGGIALQHLVVKP